MKNGYIVQVSRLRVHDSGLFVTATDSAFIAVSTGTRLAVSTTVAVLFVASAYIVLASAGFAFIAVSAGTRLTVFATVAVLLVTVTCFWVAAAGVSAAASPTAPLSARRCSLVTAALPGTFLGFALVVDY